MHLIAVDAQRLVKMPLASLADISIVGVVVIHIFFFLFFFFFFVVIVIPFLFSLGLVFI